MMKSVLCILMIAVATLVATGCPRPQQADARSYGAPAEASTYEVLARVTGSGGQWGSEGIILGPPDGGANERRIRLCSSYVVAEEAAQQVFYTCCPGDKVALSWEGDKATLAWVPTQAENPNN